jgi:DNA topoisomerase-1
MVKSSGSSSKDKHSSNSGSKHKSKDKDRDRERDKDKSSSNSTRDKHKSSSSSSKHRSKDKERDRERNSDKHKSSSSSKREKSSHHKEGSLDSSPIIKKEPDVKEEEIKSPTREFSINCERLDLHNTSYDTYGRQQLKKEKEESPPLPVKSEPFESESENNFVECKAEMDDNLSYENEAAIEENDSEEDIPLSRRRKVETDSEDEAPLSARKKPKLEKKKKRVKNESEDDEYDSDFGKTKKKKVKHEPPTKVDKRLNSLVTSTFIQSIISRQ